MNPPTTQSLRPERRGTPSIEDTAERTRRTGTPPLSLRSVRDSKSPVHNHIKGADASALVPKQLSSISNTSLASSTDTGRSSPSTGRGRGRPPASSKTSTTASRRNNVSSPSSPLSPASDDFSSSGESARTMTPKVLRQRVKQLKRVAMRDMREMLQFHRAQAAAAATDSELASVLGDSKKVIHDLKTWLETLEAYEEQYKGLWSSGKSSTASSSGSDES
ncbi:hypothetical protein BCR44DRAFT_51946 [Catenaria anguillulae PL171]|uniref:Uncharacterized protein n=1 Tax=Catenaria anguillulae PL171 TaxID=765915 RepID=A0A1Y2HEL1_9FUNG|nr:hypothetical protein BCR44DRAFT_51946 [Catenaria anguillulae PL171]